MPQRIDTKLLLLEEAFAATARKPDKHNGHGKCRRTTSHRRSRALAANAACVPPGEMEGRGYTPPQPAGSFSMFLSKLLSPLPLLLCVGLAWSCALPAQEPKRWAHQAWSTEDGLPQNSVHAVLQASEGLMWVATEAGLARFDGYSFQSSGDRATSAGAFPKDDLCCLAQDSVGGLWIGTSAGLVRGHGRRFARIGGAGPVRDLAATDDGGVLALTAEGLVRADAHGVRGVPVAGATAVSAAGNGSVWIFTPDGVMRYSRGVVDDGRIPGTWAGAPVLGVTSAGDGVWLRTARSVVRTQPGATPSGAPAQIWQVGRELPGTRVETILADADGGAWVGTNRGLVRVSAKGGVSTPAPELSSASVLAITRDSEGDLWVGTETTGLHILRPQRFRTVAGLEDQAITSVVEATSGAIWLGTREDGLRVVRAERAEQEALVTRPEVSGKLASQVVLALAAGQANDVWVGTPDGLNHVEANGRVTLVSSASGLPDDFVRSLLVEADGSVWVGTRRGLAHVAGGIVDQVLTSEDGLRSELVGALLKTSEGDLWIATLDGLSRLHDGRITTYTARDGLVGNVVTSLAADATGTLWVGTRDGGLTRFADRRFVAFGQAGLPASVESMVLIRGSLWLGTRKGVTRVATAALAACAEVGTGCALAVSRYGYTDGLPSEDLAAVGHPAAAVTRSGELWFATPHGVALAGPGQEADRNAPTPVVLERMEADGVDQPLAEVAPVLPAGQRSLSFTYAGLSYRAPSRVAYRYRLEGFDSEWIDAGGRRTAFYTNLPPGPYRFAVQAAGGNGLWSDRPATVDFRILPPIYRRWWFYLLCLAVLGGLAYLVYDLRLRRVRAQFAAVLGERNRIAREIHDTLAQDLVGVSLQVEVVTQMVRRGNVEGATEHLERTRRLVQEGIADARESIWELRATTSEGSLPSRLARLAERARERGVPTELKIGGTYRRLPTRWESEILRVAGEAVNNSIRHAGATGITVTCDYAPELLLLRIGDDGRGFDPSAAPPAGRHFGMRGMRERAENIRGDLQIESAPGAGTVVTLRVTLDDDPDGKKRQHG